MKLKNSILYFSALSILFLFSCKKEKVSTNDDVGVQVVMNHIDSLTGNYIGYRYYIGIESYGGGTYYSFDSVLTEVNVSSINTGEIIIKDIIYSACDRIIQIDSATSYSGLPLGGSPEGYYNLSFFGDNFDSLNINKKTGGSQSFPEPYGYSSYTTYNYRLVRE